MYEEDHLGHCVKDQSERRQGWKQKYHQAQVASVEVMKKMCVCFVNNRLAIGMQHKGITGTLRVSSGSGLSMSLTCTLCSVSVVPKWDGVTGVVLNLSVIQCLLFSVWNHNNSDLKILITLD